MQTYHCFFQLTLSLVVSTGFSRSLLTVQANKFKTLHYSSVLHVTEYALHNKELHTKSHTLTQRRVMPHVVTYIHAAPHRHSASRTEPCATSQSQLYECRKDTQTRTHAESYRFTRMPLHPHEHRLAQRIAHTHTDALIATQAGCYSLSHTKTCGLQIYTAHRMHSHKSHICPTLRAQLCGKLLMSLRK